MRNQKILQIILLLSFIFLLNLSVSAMDEIHEMESVPAPEALELNVQGAILIDADTGEALYRYQDTQKLYPASTTKLMTCYLTLKYGYLDDYVTLPAGIREGLTESSSTANLIPGEVVTVRQLLQCLMIVSANEAANALAYYVSGSIEDFVALMNEEALALGCENTHFTNPNGLHDEDHYTCAADLARIAQAAVAYEAVYYLCSTPEVTIPETNLSEERTLKTTNYLLEGTDFPDYYYPGAFGLKTGYTTPAGYCLVSAATREGRTLIGVVMGAEKEDTPDGERIGSFTETEKLLDWGFANYQEARNYQSYLDLMARTEEPQAQEPPEEDSEDTEPQEDTDAPEAPEEPELQDFSLESSALELSPQPTETPEPVLPEPVILEPEPVPEPSPAHAYPAAALILNFSSRLGVPAETLVIGILIGIAGLLLILILLFIHLIRKSRRNRRYRR